MRHPHLIPILLVSLLVAACGGGGGGGSEGDGSTGPAPNVTGWWLESWDDRENPEGIRPFRLVELTDDGTTVEYGGLLLEKNDRSLSLDDPSATAPDRQVWRYTIESSSRIAGFTERYLGGALDSADLRRLTPAAAPTGTLAISGRVEGVDTDIDATHAYVIETRHGSGQIQLSIMDPDQPGFTNLNLVGWGSTPIPAGTYEVGYDPGELQCYVRIGTLFGQATSGNVTLTTSTAEESVGWYIVELDDGAPLLGSFDARIRVIVE